MAKVGITTIRVDDMEEDYLESGQWIAGKEGNKGGGRFHDRE